MQIRGLLIQFEKLYQTHSIPTTPDTSTCTLFRGYGSHIDFFPPGHPIMINEIDIYSFFEQLISMIIMGCPGSKINMAAVSAKRSIALAFS